jgi:hypothetical protein
VRSGPGHDFFDDRLDFGAIDLLVDLLRETIHRPPNLLQPATVLEDDLLHEHDLVIDLIQLVVDVIQAAIDLLEVAIDVFTKALQRLAEDLELRLEILNEH